MSSSTRPLSSASRPASSGTGVGIGIGIGVVNSAFSRPPSSSLSESKKRKRECPSIASDDLVKAPVVLKPYPSSLTVKPRILHPLMLLPRENLPLSLLDLAQPHGEFPGSRLYESRIKILDLEGRLGSNVLLARSEANRMIYALEREGTGLYVLCKLGGWADVEELARCATVVCAERIKSRQPRPLTTSFPALITPQMHKEDKRRKLAIEEIHQSIVRKRSSTVTDRGDHSQLPTPTGPSPVPDVPNDQSVVAKQDDVTTPVETSLQTPNVPTSSNPHQTPGDDSIAQPNAEAIFQTIRSQYLEALYHSMGSLAYFAKGPLSRARAAFHLDCDSILEMNDLIDFLRSLVTSTVLIDKKYRETIPEIVARMKTHVEDSDEGESKSRKRKPKKPKLGKDGLYPSEIEHVRRWWIANKPVSHDEDGKMVASVDARYLVSCLRRRETQLQMILILEILALEPLRRPTEAAEESQLPGMESQNTCNDAAQDTVTRKKNKTNLPVLLDVHADRLCIWQSTTLDEVKSLAEAQNPTAGQDAQKSDRANSDPLRDFCVDIIVPFFSARLPELCDSINRKLGGPVVQAPQKEKYAKPAIPLKSKPGAPVKRSSATKKGHEKTLQHVLSKERMRRSVSRGPSGALALMRSASATTIPGLKREGSEPLLAMIPREESGSLEDRPANVFSRSMSSIATQETKAKKAALVDAELKDAISALKRPNRALAVKEFVDAAEKRVSATTVPPKKLKRPTRVSNVQVKATPANNRFKDVAAESHLDSLEEDMEPIPPSSVVPASSAPARRFANIFESAKRGGTPKNPKMVYQIQATPTRKSSASMPIVAEAIQEENADNLLSSPVMARKAAPSAHLAAPPRIRLGNTKGSNNHNNARSQNNLILPSSPGLAGLFETPLKSRSSKDNSNRSLMIMRGSVDDTPIKAKFLPVKPTVTAGGENDNTTMTTTTPEKSLGGVLSETLAGKIVATAANAQVQQEKTQTPNIYQHLGWDDDFDDLA